MLKNMTTKNIGRILKGTQLINIVKYRPELGRDRSYSLQALLLSESSITACLFVQALGPKNLQITILKYAAIF